MAEDVLLPSYLDMLNPEQKEAVIHEGSPLLILAGAGSGKTRVITTKIAYLISNKHIDPSAILAVTFTKKAASEMAERAVALEPRAYRAQIRTFHSFGAWFLRKYASEAGLAGSFTVYDDDDMATLVTKAVPSLTRQQAHLAAHKISLAKDYCLGPDDDLSGIDPTGGLSAVYHAYQERLHTTGNADFGDLIMRPVEVMEANERIRQQMRYRFRVIMVDEYQDSNVAQFRLLQSLSGADEDSGTYVCVVGDDDQSIYRFRGAEVKNILSFREKFPGTKIIKLVRNYRSTAKILEVADNVVRNNEGRLGKTLKAERGQGKTPVLVYLPDQDTEARFCADLILKACNDTKNPSKYSDWAILYRTNAQSLGFETEFLHRKIPYVVVGSLKFYEREEVKDTLAFLSLAANPRDEIAFRRIVNKPAHGVGEKTQDLIIEKAASSSLSLTETAKECIPSLSKKAREGVAEFCAVLEELNKSFNPDEKLSCFVEKVLDRSGLLNYHRTQDEITGTQRAANMQELVNSAVLYPCTQDGLLQFLDTIELDRSLDAGAGDAAVDSVTLITLHNTKGLEFPRVIITGMENGIFPRGDKSGDELEEERRLFYVGITRAQDELYITSCAQRRLYGRTEYMEPSPFIQEAGNVFKVLGKTQQRRYGMSAAGMYRNTGVNVNSVKAEELALKWSRGTKVYHDDWGYGQIITGRVSDDGEFVITVQFESGEKKKFMPEYQAHSLMIIKE
ncbi:MAG: ATP-dependent helicase [Treponema sp.]|nr:ATP-dependent helicase [Treponema sp.]